MGWQPGDAGQKQRRWRPGGGSRAPQTLSRRSTFFLQTAEKRMLSTKCCLCMRAHNHVHRLSMPVVGECCYQMPQCCHNTVHHTNCSIHSTVCSPNRKWHSRTHTLSLSFFMLTFMFYLIENAAEVTDCCLFVAADMSSKKHLNTDESLHLSP